MSVFKRFVGLGSASLLSVFLMAVLGLLLAKILSKEDFGITRVVASYLIALSLLGHFTVHDALSSYVAKITDEGDRKYYFVGATCLVLLSSIIVATIFSTYVYWSGLWDGKLKEALVYVSMSLPFLCLTLAYVASLQAIGSYKVYGIVTILGGTIPVMAILPLSDYFGVNGWIAGRVAANILLFLIALYVIREYIKPVKDKPNLLKKITQLWRYARIQMVSGLLSLVMLSADVIVLERMTSNLSQVANYGMALLFAKAILIIASTLGRVYFKELSAVEAYTSSVYVIQKYLVINLVAGLAAAIGLILIGPYIITFLYGSQYEAAGGLLINMSYGIVFCFLWNAISVVNVTQAHTQDSAWISSVGALFGIILLVTLIPQSEALGAVWAMNIAYAIGSILGIFLLARRGFIFIKMKK